MINKSVLNIYTNNWNCLSIVEYFISENLYVYDDDASPLVGITNNVLRCVVVTAVNVLNK